MVNSLLPFNCFSLNKLTHTYNQFACDENGKIQNSRFKALNQGTFLISLPISLFIGIEMEDSLLPFYCFSLNKLKHTYNQFECDEYGKVQ